MKTCLALLIIAAAFILSCRTQNRLLPPGTDNVAANDTVRIANDELEYEVVVFDPGFNNWLQTRARPRQHYSQEYLEGKNRLWIMEWNTRVLNPTYRNLYQMRIDYDNSIDYGYEVNYLLYNYLVYFQISNGQRLGGIVPEF